MWLMTPKIKEQMYTIACLNIYATTDEWMMFKVKD